MKNIKTFEEFLNENASDEFKYHHERGLDISNSIFRFGSNSYNKLFEETKKYWNEDNIILKGKAAWMAKNLEVGTKAKFETESGKFIDVELDIPNRGGKKKYIVYRNSGKKDEEGNIIAKKIEFGNPGMKIKNNNPEAAASFWARQQCDSKDKQNPDTPGFWSCYSASLFSRQLGLSSSDPW